MNKILSLSQSHLKRIIREPFLLFIFILPFLLGILYKIVIPILTNLLDTNFDLTEYYPLIMIFLVMMSPILFGWVIGFSLLDDRDENILSFMAVTPLQKRGYLQFNVIAPIFLSILQAYLVLFIANLCPMNYVKLFPVILMVALETPVFALVQAAFANNKVEGLAVGKLLGIVLVAPFIAYFFDTPLSYLAGILPPFWITESYFSSGTYYWISLAIGFMVHISAIFIMMNLFDKRQN